MGSRRDGMMILVGSWPKTTETPHINARKRNSNQDIRYSLHIRLGTGSGGEGCGCESLGVSRWVWVWV